MITEKQDYDVKLTGEILQIERLLDPIVDQMNKNPLVVDRAKLSTLHLEWVSKMSKEAIDLEKETGLKGFRANSSADCVAYFMNKGWTPEKTTSKGRPSMDKDVLQDLVKTHPIAERILQARETIAIFGQLNALAKIMDAEKSDEVQPKWNQLGTPMGRLSCEGIAIQNRVKEVQECFVPHGGFTFISVDISQAEYVGWASLSKDPLLAGIFSRGLDLHEQMGEMIAAKVPVLPTVDRRELGKRINFALLYMMQASTLAKMLGCSVRVAEEIISIYESLAEDAVIYRKKILEKAEDTGVVSTKFGRIRNLPGLLSTDAKILNDAKKTAWHHHNAGSVADLVKIKWLAINQGLLNSNLVFEQTKWVMNRHDELILEVRNDRETIDRVRAEIDRAMGAEVDGFLPLTWKITEGPTWASVSS